MKIARKTAIIASLLVAPFLLSPVSLAADEAAASADAAATSAKKVPVLVLDGSYPEVKAGFDLFDKEIVMARDLIATVRRAKEDKDVRALILRIESPGLSLTSLMDLRRAILDVREAGKPVYASFESVGLGGYVLASAADEIVIGPVGSLELMGINAQSYFFKGTLEKIGAKADVVNTGRYKTAMESFTHDKMSDGNREQIGEIIDDIMDELAADVAEGRGIDEDDAMDILTDGPFTAKKALEKGYVDRIGYIEEIQDALNEEAGTELDFDWEYADGQKKKEEPPNFFALLMGGGLPKAAAVSDADPKVAVVYAVGPIVDGRNDDSPFNSTVQIASEDFIDLLDEVTAEQNLKALVLRVDSPGGSAIASDRIWTRLEEIKAAGTPIVVSMGDVAGSGGYYISMGADHIIADPTTITGSIGVIYGRITLGGTMEKLGVTKDGIQIGKHAGLYDETRLWTASERKLLNEFVEDVYDTFTSKAAEGRGLTQKRIKELGGGRLWSGSDAVDNGLVDELGGIDRAVEVARELASAPDAKVVYFPKDKSFMELFEEVFSMEMSTRTARSIATPDAFALLEQVVPKRHLDTARFVFNAMSADRPPALAVMTQIIDIR